MSTRLQGVIGWLNAVVRQAAFRPDAQLLEQFLHRRDETAFALLMHRHGPMVLGVCRRLLGDGPDCDDAFQATFLVLLCKAGAIACRERLGPWLYGVALRTAQKARFRRDRQRAVERRADPLPELAAVSSPPADGVEVLDEELHALAARYRLPLMLCELQGLSRREAAGQLGLAEGTLSSRLARGRQLLRRRLARRGVALTAVLASAAVPAELAAQTVRAAALWTAGAEAVPRTIFTLAEGVLRTMTLSKTKVGLAALAMLLMLASLSVLAALSPAAVATDPPPAAGPPAPVAKQPPAPPPASKRVVALIHGDVAITREELGEWLIARYGAEKLDLLINQRIIEHACTQKGITVSAKEVEAALEEDLATLQLKRPEFENHLRKHYGKSLFEWQEDVIKPRLLLGKLCRADVKVGDDELRQRFEQLYGEKVRCQAILWPRGEEAAARAALADIGASEEKFDRAAKAQTTPALAAAGGMLPPLSRHDGGADQAVVEAAFRLKPGEVSPLLTTKDGGTIVLRCLGRVPAVAGKDFAAEKPALLQDVLARKIAQEIPKLFQAQRDAAKPQIFLKSAR
jgi:RNA polymerase sigma factor (sigma-70 family)